MVFAMVVVGGATRLTHSGLSIVEWQPIVGTLPPLSDADWQTTFDKYKQTPEYRLVNQGMSLDAFKGIFWWEYFHRLLGRTIGIVLLLPMLVFWRRGAIDRRLLKILAGIFVLGGLQGAMGWYMVKSGLVEDPAVSPFRLTAHLLLAFAIFAALWWTALSLWHAPSSAAAPFGPRKHAWLATLVTVYMVTTGGFVAGTHAGLAYNTFPLMGEHLVPPEIWLLRPWWQNVFYNIATVQFDHRLGAWALFVIVPWLWWRVRAASSDARARRAAGLLVLALAAQIALGIMTLLLAVPLWAAVLHQSGAVLVFAAALNLNHALRATSTPAA
ncbi:MAG: heme A synthase [Acidobacteria bacterium]|nr:MAG: heme A synthase [Acidobacteriota bacterium]